jgi:hypothetical protein
MRPSYLAWAFEAIASIARLLQSPDCFNRPIASIARCFIGEASPLKLKEEVDLKWSEEAQEWAE